MNREQRLKERAERMVNKRAPGKDKEHYGQSVADIVSDASTITVTDTNTADYVTVTSTSTAAAKTVTVVSKCCAKLCGLYSELILPAVVTTTATSTPPPVTVFSGVSSSAIVTVTPTPVTKTKTDLVLFALVTKTVTLSTTYAPVHFLSFSACANDLQCHRSDNSHSFHRGSYVHQYRRKACVALLTYEKFWNCEGSSA